MPSKKSQLLLLLGFLFLGSFLSGFFCHLALLYKKATKNYNHQSRHHGYHKVRGDRLGMGRYQKRGTAPSLRSGHRGDPTSSHIQP